MVGCVARAYVVQNGNKGAVGLPVHLVEFDQQGLLGIEGGSSIEKGRCLEAVDDLCFSPRYHGFELEEIAHKEHLYAPKRCRHKPPDYP